MSESKEMEAKASDSMANVSEDKSTETETVFTREELLQEMAKLQSKTNRLEDESRKYKRNWHQEKQTNESREKVALEEQGKFKELYEAERSKNDEYYKSIVRTKVEHAIQSQAAKAGCVSTDALIKLGNPDLLQYDETSGTVIGAETYIEEAKKSNPFLFAQRSNVSINPMTPGGAGIGAPKKLSGKDLLGMSHTDRTEMYAKLLKKS